MAYGFHFGYLGLGASRGTPSPAAPPTLSAGTLGQAALGATTANGSISTSGSSGTLYLVGVEAPDMTAVSTPSAAQVKAGQKAGGTAADSTASQAVTAPGERALSAIGTLTLSRVHRWFAVHETAAGFSDVLAFDPFVSAVDIAALALPATHNAVQAFFLPLQPACYQDVGGLTAATVGDPVRRIGDVYDPSNYATLTSDDAKPPILREDASGRWYLEPDETLAGWTAFEAANGTSISNGDGASDRAGLAWIGRGPADAGNSGFTSGINPVHMKEYRVSGVRLGLRQLDANLALVQFLATTNRGGAFTGAANDGSVEAIYGWRRSNATTFADGANLFVNGVAGAAAYESFYNSGDTYANGQKLVFRFNDDCYGAGMFTARGVENTDLVDAAEDIDFHLRALAGRGGLPQPLVGASTGGLDDGGIE